MSITNKFLALLLLSLTIIASGVYSWPRLVSQYYAYRANRVLRQAWVDPNWLPCENGNKLSSAQIGKAARAIILANDALRSFPSNSHAKLILSRAACFTGQPEKAVDAYRSYLQDRSTKNIIWAEYGFALESTGQQQQALNAWKRAGLVSDDFLIPAKQEIDKSEHAHAEKWIDRAILLEPESGETWFNIGTYLSELGDFEKSVQASQNSFQHGYTPAVMALFESYTTNNQPENAIAILQTALDQKEGAPERRSWWIALGGLQDSMGNSQDAISVYKTAHQEYPEDIEIIILYAYALQSDNPSDTISIRLLEEAVDEYPNEGRLLYTLGDIYSKQKDYKPAIKWLEKAAISAPNNQWWRLKLIRTMREAGDYENAYELAQDSMVDFPDNGLVPYEIAVISSLTGRNQDAVTAIRITLELIDDPPVYMLIRAGKIFEEYGDIDSARQLYLSALNKEPDNQQAKKFIDQLER